MANLETIPSCENISSISSDDIIDHLNNTHEYKDNTKFVCSREKCRKEMNSWREFCEHSKFHEKPCNAGTNRYCEFPVCLPSIAEMEERQNMEDNDVVMETPELGNPNKSSTFAAEVQDVTIQFHEKKFYTIFDFHFDETNSVSESDLSNLEGEPSQGKTSEHINSQSLNTNLSNSNDKE